MCAFEASADDSDLQQDDPVEAEFQLNDDTASVTSHEYESDGLDTHPSEATEKAHLSLLSSTVWYLKPDGMVSSVPSTSIPPAVLQAIQSNYGTIAESDVADARGHEKSAHCLKQFLQGNSNQTMVHIKDGRFAACRACTRKKRPCVAMDHKGKLKVRPLARPFRGNSRPTQKAFYVLCDDRKVSTLVFAVA